MALNTEGLKNSYLQLMTDMRSRTQNSDEEFAARFANMMTAFVRSGDVMPGIRVSTTGTAQAQAGATTTKGTIE
jgi:hypothetical protein